GPTVRRGMPRGRVVPVLVATALLTLCVLPARAQSSGQPAVEEFGRLAQLLDAYADVVQSAGISTINLAPVACDPAYSPGMTGVLVDLERQLLARQVAVNPQAVERIKSEFKPEAGGSAKSPAGVFKFVVATATGDREETRRVYRLSGDLGSVDLAQLAGVTGGSDVPLFNATTGKKPYVEIRGDTIYAKDADGETLDDYGVEVLAYGPDGALEPLAPTIEDGRVFVDIPTDADYAVRLVNESDSGAAVNVAIDGVSLFHYCDPEFRSEATAAPRFQRYIVPPKKSAELIGWWRNFKEVYRFRTSGRPEEESLEAGLPLAYKSPSEVGQVSVQFFRAWENSEDKPADARRDGTLGGSRKETIPGQVTESKTKAAAWSWEAEPRATITIRYDRTR
ncbi:MAG TPA: hypothetical protein VGE52_15585, partial [Pirellulales bacterium]